MKLPKSGNKNLDIIIIFILTFVVGCIGIWIMTYFHDASLRENFTTNTTNTTNTTTTTNNMEYMRPDFTCSQVPSARNLSNASLNSAGGLSGYAGISGSDSWPAMDCNASLATQLDLNSTLFARFSSANPAKTRIQSIENMKTWLNSTNNNTKSFVEDALLQRCAPALRSDFLDRYNQYIRFDNTNAPTQTVKQRIDFIMSGLENSTIWTNWYNNVYIPAMLAVTGGTTTN